MAACFGPSTPREENALMALWLTSVTRDIYIIINHVMCYCLSLVTQPSDGLLCVRALCLLIVADFLLFIQEEKTIGTRGVSI